MPVLLESMKSLAMSKKALQLQDPAYLGNPPEKPDPVSFTFPEFDCLFLTQNFHLWLLRQMPLPLSVNLSNLETTGLQFQQFLEIVAVAAETADAVTIAADANAAVKTLSVTDSVAGQKVAAATSPMIFSSREMKTVEMTERIAAASAVTAAEENKM